MQGPFVGIKIALFPYSQLKRKEKEGHVAEKQDGCSQYPVAVYLVDDQRSVTMGMRKILQDVAYLDFQAAMHP